MPDGKYRDWSRRFHSDRFRLKPPTNIQGIDGDRLLGCRRLCNILSITIKQA